MGRVHALLHVHAEAVGPWLTALGGGVVVVLECVYLPT